MIRSASVIPNAAAIAPSSATVMATLSSSVPFDLITRPFLLSNNLHHAVDPA